MGMNVVNLTSTSFAFWQFLSSFVQKLFSFKETTTVPPLFFSAAGEHKSMSEAQISSLQNFRNLELIKVNSNSPSFVCYRSLASYYKALWPWKQPEKRKPMGVFLPEFPTFAF